jgi:dihydrofolate reductase
VKDKAAEEVAALKQLPGKDMIVLGSANFAATLTENGLIDEYRLMVFPVVLGSGHAHFQAIKRRLSMRLVNAKPFRSGNVLLCYEPKL